MNKKRSTGSGKTTGNRNTRSRSLRTSIRRLPSWMRWGGAVVITAFYVWAFYYFFVSPFGFRWRALFGEPDYPQGYEIHGIDISHHQGKIDWSELRNAMIAKCPLRFVMIKATEGSGHIDENFQENFYQAREYGFIRGAYHFWSIKTPAREQANYFLSQVHLEEGDLPPVLDVENIPADISVEDFQREVLTWLHVVEDKYHV
ncbi:MAG: glycoside hydrolase family 25 protein, partial [Prevotella sp.]|nr:glycoside hydrolase family 25 protein [Prevotella sp.]